MCAGAWWSTHRVWDEWHQQVNECRYFCSNPVVKACICRAQYIMFEPWLHSVLFTVLSHAFHLALALKLTSSREQGMPNSLPLKKCSEATPGRCFAQQIYMLQLSRVSCALLPWGSIRYDRSILAAQMRDSVAREAFFHYTPSVFLFWDMRQS